MEFGTTSAVIHTALNPTIVTINIMADLQQGAEYIYTV